MMNKTSRRLFAALCLTALAAPMAFALADDAGKPDADGFYSLFNGKDLTGWKANENPEVFKVENGEIIVAGPRCHLFYVGPVENHDFKDFHLKLEIKTKAKANSGVYFHTKYQDEGWPTHGFEAQVNQTHPDPKKSGSIYDVKNVMNQSPTTDDKWYTYEIMVQGKKVTISVDGKVVNEWEQPEGWQGTEGWPGRVLGSGTFALQGHDPESVIHYRNIKVKPLK